MYNEYTILSELVPYVEAKMAQANKRAERNGWPVTTMEVLSSTWKEPEGSAVKRGYTTLALRSEALKFNGWKFVAALEPGRYGNVIRAINQDVEIPGTYRHSGQGCDHCNLQRNRNAVYVIFHEESGEYKQVGRNCLKDFTGGHNIEAYVESLEWSIGLSEAILAEEEEYFSGRRQQDSFEVENVLAVASRVVREFGWVSKRSAEERGNESLSTVETVKDQLTLGPSKRDQERRLDVADADRAKAKEVLTWLRSLVERESLSQYEWNLVNVAAPEAIGYREVGILASGVQAYIREQEREMVRQRAAAESNSEYVGAVGERLNLTDLTVKVEKFFDGQWGVSVLYILEDVDGNLFQWWASSEQEFGVGDMVSGRGTVKAHEVSPLGEEQTKLTRCKFEKHKTDEEKAKEAKWAEMFA